MRAAVGAPPTPRARRPARCAPGCRGGHVRGAVCRNSVEEKHVAPALKPETISARFHSATRGTGSRRASRPTMRRGVDGDGVVRVLDARPHRSLTQRHVLRSLRPVDARRSPSGISRRLVRGGVGVRATMRAWETGTHDLGGSADGYPTTPAGPLYSALISETTTDTSAVRCHRRRKANCLFERLPGPRRASVRAAAARAAAAHGSGLGRHRSCAATPRRTASANSGSRGV